MTKNDIYIKGKKIKDRKNHKRVVHPFGFLVFDTLEKFNSKLIYNQNY